MKKSPSAIALGFFDGVHIAHRKIISLAVDYAKKNNLSPIALSFDSSPMEFLSDSGVKYLTTNEQKKEIIKSLGAVTEFLPLSRELLSMEADTFVKEILVDMYNIKYAVCGYNYRFGKNGKGDTKLLQEWGKQCGFEVTVCDCEVLLGESVSSSRIRELISEGDIEFANELLGRNFSLSGVVCEGKQLGRKLGFPTANVFFNEHTVIPKNGVYKTLVTIDNDSYTSITNTGINPTVGGEALRTETYIPDFNRNIYGKEIKIEFLGFIREERKFDSIEDLKSQIKRDIDRM